MVISTKLTAPNSLLLIMDSRGGEIPESMFSKLIASTRSCIAVGCKSEDDGETEVVLGLAHEVDSERSPAFEGSLTTPSQKVVVKSILGANFMEMETKKTETIVRIWVNDCEEPDKIIIGIA